MDIEFNNIMRNTGFVLLFIMALHGCSSTLNTAENDTLISSIDTSNYEYTIGPGDSLNIFVWRNPDVSVNGVPVRPDGKVSSPLVEDMIASGKTPVQLARDIEQVLSEYIQDPLVTITVMSFVGELGQQVRVVGEATGPRALPFSRNMSLLDVMIAVGGLTEYAAGNKAVVVRKSNGSELQINVRLNDLLKGGDISANMAMHPGDILVIPESLF